MYLDFHTHNPDPQIGVNQIYNILVDRECPILPSANWFSVGVHPWYIQKETVDQQLEFIWDIARNPQVKMVGETGLDKLVGTSLELQQEVFIQQIRIAESVQKPLVIHCVRAFNELLSIKKVLKPKVPCIIHGFSKKPEVAKELTRNGFYLSFGKALLDYPHVQEALRVVPLGNVFFETDDDFKLTVESVYQKASQVLNRDLETLKEDIYFNFLSL